MGTSDFAVPTLLEIVKHKHIIAAVYTRPPAPGGRRGLELKRTLVHSAADSLGVPVLTPATLRDAETQSEFSNLAADVAVVAAYGLRLPSAILSAPRLGCINLHASLLPRWRGAAPIQYAIMAGDPQTGVDLMRMEAGLDTGPIAMRETIKIRPEDTAGDLTQRLAPIAAKLAVNALKAMASDALEFYEQPDVGVCYAPKIEKAEGEIDWTRSAESIRNQIHALSPTPGAFCGAMIGDRRERIKLLRAEVLDAIGAPGAILGQDMTVACGARAVRIIQGQRPGKPMMSGRELMRSAKLNAGEIFTLSTTLSSGPQS